MLLLIWHIENLKNCVKKTSNKDDFLRAAKKLKSCYRIQARSIIIKKYFYGR